MIDCTGKIEDGVYNCFGGYDERQCYDCIYNSKSEAKKKINRFADYKDKIDILYKYLKGEELPEGVHCRMPKLSPRKAFSVIWFLQEILHVLPDNIEQCRVCKELFDTDCSGVHIDDQWKHRSNGRTVGTKYWGHYCSWCCPGIEIELK